MKLSIQSLIIKFWTFCHATPGIIIDRDVVFSFWRIHTLRQTHKWMDRCYHIVTCYTRNNAKNEGQRSTIQTGELWQTNGRTDATNSIISLLCKSFAVNKNRWMNEDIPGSWCCTVNPCHRKSFKIFADPSVCKFLDKLNKEFTLQHHEHGISSSIQWFLFECIQPHTLSAYTQLASW